jgi:3-hydroxyisobutyrate dehydrogenase-like beta-hydroxyacid dehydrogenase
MVKDVRLYLDEAKALGVPVEIAEAVARLWEKHAERRGIKRAAGVTVGNFEK